MTRPARIGALALGVMTSATMMIAGMVSATTLEDVKERGELNCGVNPGLAGFSLSDPNGNWSGFDVDLCRAVAAAVLGDSAKVRFVPAKGESRFDVLISGDVDLLVRNTTATYTRDVEKKLEFVAINYYDGQGFMVKKEMEVSSATELDGARICIPADTTAEQNLDEYFKAHSMGFEPIVAADEHDALRRYLDGECNTYTTDASALAAARATMADPENNIILPEIISKEPHGPVVRHGDDEWGDIVRWTFFALVIAEEKGITKANIEEVASTSTDPEVRRLLGLDGDLATKAGLAREAFKRAIATNGNYGEIFEANIGSATPIGLVRGLNALWTQGGLQYAWPMR